MNQTVKAARSRLARFQVPRGQWVGTRTLPERRVNGDYAPPSIESRIRAGVVAPRG